MFVNVKASFAFVVLFTATAAFGVPLVISYDNGVNLAAEATFDYDGTNLFVTMENISTYGVTQNNEVLASVFFNISGQTSALSYDSATVADADHIVYRWNGLPVTPAASTDVTAENQYKYLAGGFTPVPGAPQNGISNAALSGSGAAFEFGNTDGGAYGLVPTGFTGYGQDSASYTPLIAGVVTITLDNLPVGFTLADISGVVFNYGTAYGTFLVPEPGIVGSLSLLLAGLGLYLQRRNKKIA